MSKKSVKSYDNESISALKGADRVRLRPGVIFGSDALEGSQHAFFEILSNAVDEAREGYGRDIHVNVFADHSIEVIDFGRGIPMDYNPKEERWNWELVFCELYAGGKYDNLSGETYEFSLGLNGLGCCATQYASEYMDVFVTRDGFDYELHFERGNPAGELKKVPAAKGKTGSRIRFKPDRDVFTDVAIPLSYFESVLQRQAVVNAGVRFHLTFEESNGNKIKREYFYERGVIDYVDELTKGDRMGDVLSWSFQKTGRDRADKPDYKVKCETAFCFCENQSAIEYYHNSSFLEHGGSPDKAVKSAFVFEIDSYLKQTGKYTKNESKITFQDVQDSLVLVMNSFSTATSYENQTKKAINNKFIQDAINEFLRERLEIFFTENKLDADKIADRVLINKRSRESAEKARVTIKKKLSGNLDMSNRVQKFVDCRTKDVSRRELYIVEGDSALGSCKLGRNSEFQAIIPVRGKILNCLKAETRRVFANDIITDIIKVLGCGVQLPSKGKNEFAAFDLDSLRWSKVIICTDADVDGFQIRALILTMLYCLTPDLIEAGKVFIAETPLFEITAKGKTYFAYNEKEKDELVGKLKGPYQLQRSKGLGENEPEMMWETTMNPETRRLLKILPEDAEKTKEVFDMLLGDNLASRKEHIALNGYRFLEYADIS